MVIFLTEIDQKTKEERQIELDYIDCKCSPYAIHDKNLNVINCTMINKNGQSFVIKETQEEIIKAWADATKRNKKVKKDEE